MTVTLQRIIVIFSSHPMNLPYNLLVFYNEGIIIIRMFQNDYRYYYLSQASTKILYALSHCFVKSEHLNNVFYDCVEKYLL